MCVSELASYANGSIAAGTATHARFESLPNRHTLGFPGRG